MGLKDKNTGLYKNNLDFDTIKQLYVFNTKFRYLIFPEIEKVEINLRCRIANYFSLKYGVLGYKNAENFTNPSHHQSFLIRWGNNPMVGASVAVAVSIEEAMNK